MSNKDHAILSIHIIIGITTNEMLTTPRDYFLGCTVTIVLRNIASNTLWLKLTWNDPYNCSIGLELDICVNDIEVLLFVTSCIRHFVKIKCENQGRITLIMCIGYENLNRMIYAQCRPGIIVILRNACALFCYLYGACTLKWGQNLKVNWTSGTCLLVLTLLFIHPRQVAYKAQILYQFIEFQTVLQFNTYLLLRSYMVHSS